MSPPLFSPASIFWRVNRELASGLAGPRAVLLQIAHPLVAAGVADHSRFRQDRLGRLYRTSLAATLITFGGREFALRAIRSINKKHERVQGTLRTRAGVFPAGTRYDANDPELKLWVLATITDSTLMTYDLFVSRLSRNEREQYYQDSLIVGRLFGIPDRIVPPTYDDFERYFSDMLDSDTIAVSDDAREIANSLFAGSPTGTALLLSSAVGIGLLPERLRREFGFHWNPTREKWLRRVAGLSRQLRRHVPSILCSSPMATLSEWLAVGRA
jgi:uncharacterized protein (DUF2236 family)